MNISRSVLIERPPRDVFRLVSDLEQGPDWFVGITRWDPRSKARKGIGAKYRVLVRIGSIEAGGTLAVTEWEPPRTIAWESVDGIRQRGRLRLRKSGPGTELSLEISYDLPGFGGWLAARLAGRAIARDMTATLLAARRILEFEDAPASSSAKPKRRAAKRSSTKQAGRAAARPRPRTAASS